MKQFSVEKIQIKTVKQPFYVVTPLICLILQKVFMAFTATYGLQTEIATRVGHISINP